MEQKAELSSQEIWAKDVLGYLNFSSGNREVRFFQSLDSLFRFCGSESVHTEDGCTAQQVIALLQHELQKLAEQSKVFKVDDQAGLILQLVEKHFFQEYRKFHQDLLFHQTNEFLFNSFFLGKIFETVLKQGTPWTETERIVPAVISQLNDYIGYRPIPVLEGRVEKHQPYLHEWSSTIPLYLNGIGVAAGRYSDIVRQALDILRRTEPSVLREACFDLDKMQELVMDARAYDFDHPVNRKPNYHFGLWDPNDIDNDGFYRRFVVHQVTVDGIMSRVAAARLGEPDVAGVPYDELIYEAGAVLAGTMLMGSGVCGDTPGTYTSETSLNDLMPIIAGYRDQFYEMLLVMMPDKMKPRIKAEQERLFQPFGGCRQALNRQMAKRRADQLQRMHLARLYARLGYPEAAMKQTEIISVASSRILTTIDCHITTTHLLIDNGKLEEAAANLPQIEDWIHRGIACGAIVDPWTMLGFGGTFSLFHNAENAIHDHRVDDLINLLEEIFDLYSRLEKEAAASGNGDLQSDLSDKMSGLAGWWDQFGSTEVDSLESFSGNETWESAAVVSTALAAWHKAGTAAGDVAFWQRHVDRFKSPKAFVLLAEALLDQQDPVASMALLMHWLSHSEKIPLIEGDYSFHSILLRWMEQLWRDKNDVPKTPRRQTIRNVPPLPFEERWQLTQKFFDFLEANADEYWEVPTLELEDEWFAKDKGSKKKDGKKTGGDKADKSKGKPKGKNADTDSEGEEPDFGNIFDYPYKDKPRKKRKNEQEDSPFQSLYDEMSFHDSTDDGIDGSMMDVPAPGSFNDDEDFEIISETERISDRLTFIVSMTKLWKFVTERIAKQSVSRKSGEVLPNMRENGSVTDAQTSSASFPASLDDAALAWLRQITKLSGGLHELLQRVSEYQVPPPKGTSDSLLEYDRHRGTKEILIDRIVWTQVEVRDAKMLLEAFLGSKHWESHEEWETAVLYVLQAVFSNDTKAVKKLWGGMRQVLARETILYVPTSRGGSAHAIVRCRCIQQAIIRLMEYAPRLGLLIEAFGILSTVQTMEEMNTISPGAITEFDRLVETATRAITKCVSVSARSWKMSRNSDKERELQDAALVDYMEQIVEQLLACWLSHSKQIRVSTVESIVDRNYWDDVKRFIQQYGHDIFTQQNMGFGNLRAMLHQGVGNYLRSLLKIRKDGGEVEIANKLLDDLERRKIDWDSAVARLEIILESVAENYSEYVDYNSTTTHSDHGEKLYMLLDMLRVQVGYERVSWNLKPVYWIHDAMIRSGCDGAAVLWEKAVANRSLHAAEEHVRHYNRLSEKYGMWLPSIYERLEERFVRPLQIDRMCGLVPKAARQVYQEGEKTAFGELAEQVENFAKTPLGVGFEMPEWLSALQEEVMMLRLDDISEDKDTVKSEENDIFGTAPHFDQICLSRYQLDKIIQTLINGEGV
ncbi:MAG: hypothetical protein LBT89_03695 [Planctomycetaceae bacterium]|jgi:hypothetical protein|nr:hypothetical protein [Planctomycetaceae bacterium]